MERQYSHDAGFYQLVQAKNEGMVQNFIQTCLHSMTQPAADSSTEGEGSKDDTETETTGEGEPTEDADVTTEEGAPASAGTVDPTSADDAVKADDETATATESELS